MKSFKFKLYCYSFLTLCKPFYVLGTIIIAYKGFSPIQLASVLLFYALAKVFFEFPSGVIADRFSRKYVIFTGSLILTLTPLLILSDNFLLISLSFIIAGIGGSLLSGTEDAFIYDELKYFKAEESYGKVISNHRTLAWVGFGVASIIAGLLRYLDFGYEYIIWLNFFFSVLTCLAVLSFKETGKVKTLAEDTIIKIAKDGINTVLLNKDIRFIALMYISYFMIFFAMGDVYSLICKKVGWQDSFIAFFIAFQVFVEAVVRYMARYFENLKTRSLIWMGVFSGSISLFAAYHFAIWTPPLLWAVFLVGIIIEIVINVKINHRSESRVRASALSFMGFAIEVKKAIALLVFGILSGYFSYRAGVMFFTGTLLVAMVTFLVISFFKKSYDEVYQEEVSTLNK